MQLWADVVEGRGVGTGALWNASSESKLSTRQTLSQGLITGRQALMLPRQRKAAWGKVECWCGHKVGNCCIGIVLGEDPAWTAPHLLGPIKVGDAKLLKNILGYFQFFHLFDSLSCGQVGWLKTCSLGSYWVSHQHCC